MILTREIAELAKTPNGGYRDAKIRVFVKDAPIRKGWLSKRIGLDFPEETIKEFIEAGRDKPKGDANQLFLFS